MRIVTIEIKSYVLTDIDSLFKGKTVKLLQLKANFPGKATLGNAIDQNIAEG